MTRPSFLCVPVLSIVLAWGAIAPTAVQAETALKKATITTLRNRVRLKGKGSPLRSAQPSDILKPGDRLTTGRSSLAEFRFNDGTLARMGELALFRFVPRQRNFFLNQGTVLLLIPPGKGISRVRTPNIQAGIRGSALFVRHDPDTNTTIVGALTNSGIEVSDRGTNQIQELKAGQMVVAVDGQIESLYDFDLATFYETSVLGEGILQGKAKLPKVLQEIQEGLAFQANLALSESGDRSEAGDSKKTLKTPDFVRLSASQSNPSSSISPSGTSSKDRSGSTVESTTDALDDSSTSETNSISEEILETSIGSTALEGAEIEGTGAFPGQAIGNTIETLLIEEGIEKVIVTGQEAGDLNAQEDIQEDIQNDIQGDVQDDIQGDVQDDIQDDVQGDIQDDVQDDVQGDIQDDIQDDVQDDGQNARDFPGRGNGVTDGFPGGGNTNGFPNDDAANSP